MNGSGWWVCHGILRLSPFLMFRLVLEIFIIINGKINHNINEIYYYIISAFFGCWKVGFVFFLCFLLILLNLCREQTYLSQTSNTKWLENTNRLSQTKEISAWYSSSNYLFSIHLAVFPLPPTLLGHKQYHKVTEKIALFFSYGISVSVKSCYCLRVQEYSENLKYGPRCVLECGKLWNLWYGLD